MWKNIKEFNEIIIDLGVMGMFVSLKLIVTGFFFGIGFELASMFLKLV